MLGPDFTRPKVSWLDAWAARPLEQPTPQLTGPPIVSADQWWRNFNDPVMEELVAEAQRLNPGVRTAGARILEARALVGIARSGLFPQLQQFTANRAGGRHRAAGRPGYRLHDLRHGFHHRLGDGFLGQVQARRRGGGLQLSREHRALRRHAGARRVTGGGSLQLHPHHRAQAAHCQGKRRAAEAEPRDHGGTLRKRQRHRTGRATGESPLPQHAGDHSGTGSRAAPGAQRAGSASRKGSRAAAGTGHRLAENPAGAARCDRGHAGQPAATPPGCQGGRNAAGGAVGPDRRERGATLSRHRAGGIGRPRARLAREARLVARQPGLGPGAQPGVERVRPRPADEPGAGRGCPLPAVLRTISGNDPPRGPGSRRFRGRIRPQHGADHAARTIGGCGEALAGNRHHPIPRRPRRLPAGARLAEDPFQPAGAAGHHPRRGDSKPDRALQGDGRRLAGRARPHAARRGDAHHDG